MIRIQFFLIFLLLPLTMRSQEDICIGKRYSLYSAFLQEEPGLLDISASKLRSGYDTELSRHLSTRRRLFFPFIGRYQPNALYGQRKISSVLHHRRGNKHGPDTRLYSTASAAGRSGKTSPGAIPQGGGSETFRRFLTEELRSVIDSTYRTNGLNMLIGHSYSGLFTVNTFLRHTELFDIYLALDPACGGTRESCRRSRLAYPR